MKRSLQKVWNVISTIIVAIVVILALLLVGARVVGLQVFTVLSGSMEPTYHTGSLIYVKKVDPYTIEPGQPITFMLDENTIATHRVVGIVPDEEDPTVIRFRWDYDRLKIAPCRQFGSSRTDDLVIAAHNYDTHFGKLRELSEGETVLFTDMEGIVSTYCVEKLETLSPDAVDTVLNSGYDLVLYTCTKGGRTRVIVFCDRAAETASSSAPRQTEK